MRAGGYPFWRQVHRVSSAIVVIFALLHASLTAILHDRWSSDAVWFLGAGLGLLLLGALNLSHIGIEPCRDPTARLVRWANYLFVLFGAAAVVAVPEPQAIAAFGALVLQAAAMHWTLPGPVRHPG